MKVNDLTTITDFNIVSLTYPHTDLNSMMETNISSKSESLHEIMNPGGAFVSMLAKDAGLELNEDFVNNDDSLISGIPFIVRDESFKQGGYKSGRYMIKFMQTTKGG